MKCIAFNPKDPDQFASSSNDCIIKLWQVSMSSCVSSVNVGSGVQSLSYAPSGNIIAAGTYNGAIHSFNPGTGEKIGLALSGDKPIRSLAFSPSGKVIAAGDGSDLGGGGDVRLYDLTTGTAIGHPLKGHTDRVKSVGWSSDGKKIVSGSWDHTERVWDASTGEELCTLRGHRYASCLRRNSLVPCFSADLVCLFVQWPSHWRGLQSEEPQPAHQRIGG